MGTQANDDKGGNPLFAWKSETTVCTTILENRPSQKPHAAFLHAYVIPARVIP